MFRHNNDFIKLGQEIYERDNKITELELELKNKMLLLNKYEFELVNNNNNLKKLIDSEQFFQKNVKKFKTSFKTLNNIITDLKFKIDKNLQSNESVLDKLSHVSKTINTINREIYLLINIYFLD
jgi:chromosome segregation ATPase